MKRYIIIIFLHISFFCVFISCDPTSGKLFEHRHIQFDKEYWGEWFSSIEMRDIYYITNNTIDNYYYNDYERIYPNIEKDSKVSLKKISPNMIEMTRQYIEQNVYGHYNNNETKTILIASRLQDSSFNGHVVENVESRSLLGGRAVKGIGGIDVVVSNINNSAINQKVKTDEYGNFEVNNIIIGDEYEVKIADDVNNIEPKFNGEDVGNFSVSNRSWYGIKMKLSDIDNVLTTLDGDLTYLFTNNGYWVNIWFTTGRAYDGRKMNYKITLPDGIRTNYDLSDTLEYKRDSIVSNRVGIQFYIFCDSISSEYEIKKIGVTITDEDGECEHSVSVRLYRDKVTFHFYYEHPDNYYGYRNQYIIRNPNIGTVNQIIWNEWIDSAIEYNDFDYYSRQGITWDSENNCTHCSIYAPRYSGAEYLFILNTNGNINFAVDRDITPDFTGNIESGRTYDENNARTIIPGEIIKLNTNGNFSFFKLKY